jgi:hypothetical protein
VITIDKKQSLFCLSADVENNYSLNKIDIKNDEFKVKCLIENLDLNKEKLQIDLSYNVTLIPPYFFRLIIFFLFKRSNTSLLFNLEEKLLFKI